MQLASPRTLPTWRWQCVLIGLACGVVVRAGKRDIPETLDAVGLAEHIADLWPTAAAAEILKLRQYPCYDTAHPREGAF
jgi:hypothetical protein